MILVGKRVRLRPLKLSDAPRFVKWLKDPEVNKFTTRKSITLADELKWIREIRRRERGPSPDAQGRDWAIDVAGHHIGSVGLIMRGDPKDRSGMLDILIGDKRYWDKGYGSETIALMLRYGFARYHLHRIGLRVYAYNHRAIATYHKLGFRLVGREREKIRYGNTYYDQLTMDILANEWKKKRPKMMKLIAHK